MDELVSGSEALYEQMDALAVSGREMMHCAEGPSSPSSICSRCLIPEY